MYDIPMMSRVLARAYKLTKGPDVGRVADSLMSSETRTRVSCDPLHKLGRDVYTRTHGGSIPVAVYRQMRGQ